VIVSIPLATASILTSLSCRAAERRWKTPGWFRPAAGDGQTGQRALAEVDQVPELAFDARPARQQVAVLVVDDAHVEGPVLVESAEGATTSAPRNERFRSSSTEISPTLRAPSTTWGRPS